MDTPTNSKESCDMSEAEKKRRYRERIKQCETNEQRLEHHRKDAERQRKYKQALANCSTQEEITQHK